MNIGFSERPSVHTLIDVRRRGIKQHPSTGVLVGDVLLTTHYTKILIEELKDAVRVVEDHEARNTAEIPL